MEPPIPLLFHDFQAPRVGDAVPLPRFVAFGAIKSRLAATERHC